MQHSEDASMRSIQLVQIHQGMLSDCSLIPYLQSLITATRSLLVSSWCTQSSNKANESGHEGSEDTYPTLTPPFKLISLCISCCTNLASCLPDVTHVTLVTLSPWDRGQLFVIWYMYWYPTSIVMFTYKVTVYKAAITSSVTSLQILWFGLHESHMLLSIAIMIQLHSSVMLV